MLEVCVCMGCQVYMNSRMLTGIIRIGELLDLIQAVDHLEESGFLFCFLRMHSFRCTFEAYTASTPLPVATALQVTNLPYTQHASLSVARTLFPQIHLYSSVESVELPIVCCETASCGQSLFAIFLIR